MKRHEVIINIIGLDYTDKIKTCLTKRLEKFNLNEVVDFGISNEKNYDIHVVICSSSCIIDKSKYPPHNDPIIIPVLFNENDKMDESIKGINAFLFDKGNESTSIDRLCDAVLEKLGIIKNTRKVFISYKRSESSVAAERIRRELLKEGYSVFLDKKSIEVGTDFMQDTILSLTDSDVFVLLGTPSYMNGRYTKKELYSACIAGIDIILVTTKDYRKDIPQGFKVLEVESINRMDEKDLNDLKKLVKTSRTNVLKNRRERLFRKMESITLDGDGNEKTLTLNALHIENEKARHSYFPILGIPSSMDFQKVQEKKEKKKRQKVTAVYDDLILPYEYARHLNWLGSSMRGIKILKTSNIKTENMSKPVVFLSASVPNDEDNRYSYLTIHNIIVTLTEEIINRGGTLVFGGHPTITPIISNIIDLMKQNCPNDKDTDTTSQTSNIILYQSKYFEDKYPEEVNGFSGELKEIEMETCEGCSCRCLEKSLLSMRISMMKDYKYTSAIFIGGKFKDKEYTESGVWKEYELFRQHHKDAKCLVFKDTGIIPEKLWENWQKMETDRKLHKLITVEELTKEI